MTTYDLLQALARLRVETGSLACLGCGREHNCSTKGCRILREAADLIRQLSDENTELREEVNLRGNAVRTAKRKRAKAEAERDALLEQIKARRSCLDCKYFDYCEFDDATVIDCINCITKNCPCYQCGNSSRWEWRGLPEAPEEGKT